MGTPGAKSYNDATIQNYVLEAAVGRQGITDNDYQKGMGDLRAEFFAGQQRDRKGRHAYYGR